MINETNKIVKPVGVYILTICIFLRFGVFQLISDFNSIQNADSKIPIGFAIILIGRNLFVALAAVFTFFGENFGRIFLLTIVSLNVIWTIFDVLTFVSYNEQKHISLSVTFNLINPLFWLILCWWYLNRKNVVEYYKQNERN